MEDYKEFTGKNLDEAMAAACSYFGLERGKLEIEILNDAKSGIFGLVGAKKASVRARKAQLESLHLTVGGEREEKKQPQNSKPRQDKPRQEKPRQEKQDKPREQKADARREARPAPAPVAAQEAEAPASESKPAPRKNDRRNERSQTRAENAPADRQEGQQERGEGRPNGRGRGKGKPERKPHNRPERSKQPRPDKPRPSDDGPEEKFPDVPLESMDQALLESEVLTAVDSMTRHIVGETEKEFELAGGKARVRVNSGEDSGLLIGRDGQTLSALQYLASCIVSRRMGASVRVQIDAGDYRNRQLEKLRLMAVEMAAKVKETSKPQSTRPMSAYLRRVIHMALQEDPDVQTHSKGDGSLKRVVIVPKKK